MSKFDILRNVLNPQKIVEHIIASVLMTFLPHVNVLHFAVVWSSAVI